MGQEKIIDMCNYFKITRQAYYKSLKHKEQQEIHVGIVLDLVREIRKKQPRVGGKKLYLHLYKDLQLLGNIGRDKFFDILRTYDLLVKRKKSYTKTTNSFHRFHKWTNLIIDKDFIQNNTCWVSDITYIRTEQGFVYLFLITDLYSRKIVGWDLSDSLSIEGGIRALKMALRQRQDKELPLIHHSDRGIQYCSKEYVKILQKHNISISMTEKNHCYENSVAERVNGILKDEFLLDSTFKNKVQANKACKEAIDTYNNVRLHGSLQFKTPNSVYLQVA